MMLPIPMSRSPIHFGNQNPYYGKWSRDDHLPGNPDNQGTRPEITGKPSVDKKYRHSLERKLDAVHITVRGEHNAIDVERTNERRRDAVREMGLRPRIVSQGIILYRDIRRDADGCLQVSYHTALPSSIEALFDDERLPIDDAARYLGMEQTDAWKLAQRRIIKRKGGSIVLESMNAYKRRRAAIKQELMSVHESVLREDQTADVDATNKLRLERIREHGFKPEMRNACGDMVYRNVRYDIPGDEGRIHIHYTSHMPANFEAIFDDETVSIRTAGLYLGTGRWAAEKLAREGKIERVSDQEVLFKSLHDYKRRLESRDTGPEPAMGEDTPLHDDAMRLLGELRETYGLMQFSQKDATRDLAAAIGQPSVKRHLAYLVRQNLVARTGGRASMYQIVAAGRTVEDEIDDAYGMDDEAV